MTEAEFCEEVDYTAAAMGWRSQPARPSEDGTSNPHWLTLFTDEADHLANSVRFTYFSTLASARPDVAEFRKKHLTDRFLPWGDADDLSLFVKWPEETRDNSAAETTQRELARLAGRLGRSVTDLRVLLGELQTVATAVSRQFPWDPDSSAFLILCGGGIHVQAVEVQVFPPSPTVPGDPEPSYHFHRFRIEGDLRLNPERLKQGFRTLQQEVLGDFLKRPGLRLSRLFEYVTQRWAFDRRLGIRRMPFKGLRQMWNYEHPDDPYTTPESLAGAFRDARRRLVGSADKETEEPTE